MSDAKFTWENSIVTFGRKKGLPLGHVTMDEFWSLVSNWLRVKYLNGQTHSGDDHRLASALLECLRTQVESEQSMDIGPLISASRVPQESQPAKSHVRAAVIADRYDVTERCVFAWADQGKIPVIRIGKTVRFDLEAVILAVESQVGSGSTGTDGNYQAATGKDTF